jgi:hypothetical protein
MATQKRVTNQLLPWAMNGQCRRGKQKNTSVLREYITNGSTEFDRRGLEITVKWV